MDVSQVGLSLPFICPFVSSPSAMDVILVKVKQSKLFWLTEHPLPHSSGPLCVRADSRVCQLQVPVLHQD